MGYYSIEKKLKTAEIGTVLPWSGDAASSLRGYEIDTRTGIPDGWLICDGRQETARNYPLLAQVLGTTYGGSIIGAFPDYNPVDVFNIPNIQSRHLADYDTTYLPADAQVQTAITPLMGANTDNSVDVTPDETANINFSVAAANNLVGKSTGLTLEDPSYFKLFYTVNRKLGQNHTPGHSHGSGYETCINDASPLAELFQQPIPSFEGNGQRVLGWSGRDGEPVDFASYQEFSTNPPAEANQCSAFVVPGGGGYKTGYGILLGALSTACDGAGGGCGEYYLFTAASGPGGPGTARHSIISNDAANPAHVFTDGPKTYSNASIAGQPMAQGYVPIRASNYPFTRNGTGNSRNWSNLNSQSANVTYATTLNHNNDQWATNDTPGGHNHGAFEVTMNRGGMRPPKTVYHNDVQTHTIAPQNQPNAFTMNITADTPSLNILYIIRAY